MDFEFWQNLADYCNFNWRGKFSTRELQEMSELYFNEWKESVKTRELSSIIYELMKTLIEDKENGSEEAESILIEIQRNCEKHHIVNNN